MDSRLSLDELIDVVRQNVTLNCKLPKLKTCNECKIDLHVDNFYIKQNKYVSICKSCTSIKSKLYFEKNKDKINERNKQYQETNRDRINERIKFNRNKNKKILNENEQLILKEEKIKKRKEYLQKYYKKNKEYKDNYRKEYYEKNKKILLKKKNIYNINKLKNDSLYKLRCNIGKLITKGFKSKKHQKTSKTQDILGCTFEEFKLHIEKQFDDKMNWDNQGSYWHLDHIKPVSLATTEQELIELNHYTNFQPLFWKDNLSKSNKYNINNKNG